MATVLPKDIKMPKFSDGKSKEEKKATPTIKEEPEMKKDKATKTVSEKEEPKKVEPVKAEKAVEEKPLEPSEKEPKTGPIKKDETASTENAVVGAIGFKKNQPILKGWRIFIPYFLAFLYNTVLLVALIAFLVIPMIRNDEVLNTLRNGLDYSFGSNPEAAGKTLFEFVGLDSLASDTYSIADVTLANLAPALKNPTLLLNVIGPLWGILLLALPLVIFVIWFVIKFIHSFIAMITCGFKHRKHHIIDNFFFKNTHQYYKLGILDFDFTFIVFLIYAIWYFAIMNIVPMLVATLGSSLPVDISGFLGAFKSLFNGFVIAEGATEAAYDQAQMLNQGVMIYIIVLAALVLIRIIYRFSVRMLSRKVRKTYLMSKKEMKAYKKAQA